MGPLCDITVGVEKINKKRIKKKHIRVWVYAYLSTYAYMGPLCDITVGVEKINIHNIQKKKCIIYACMGE